MKLGMRVGFVGGVLASCAAVAALGGMAACNFGSSTPSAKPDAASFPETGAFDAGFPETGSGGNDTGTTADAGSGEAATGNGDAATDSGTLLANCDSDGGSGTWTCVGSMATPRVAAGMAALPNGQALAAGGWNPTDGVLTSAEVYNAKTQAFTSTDSMKTPHLWAAYGAGWPGLASGSVLVAGGLTAAGALETEADIYDPVAGSFSATGPLVTGVISFFPIVLATGNILFFGGWNSTTGAPPTPGWEYFGDGTNEVQLYSATAGTFADTGPLAENRLLGCNVLLDSGLVLAIGGSTGASSTESNIEEYDPTTGKWSTVGTLVPGMTCTRAFSITKTTVLLAGDSTTAGADVLDTLTFKTNPTTGFPAGATPSFVQLQGGNVLAMGNGQSGTASAKSFLYDIGTNTWTPTGDMPLALQGFPPPLLLTTGEVLVAGGTDANNNITAAAAVYNP